ncbi:hypothetical protein [Nostoc sp.]|uniref:hypothetical protein n=2 Tax=Nostoc sp. TaxID=1180 RepID=UPI002FFC67E4
MTENINKANSGVSREEAENILKKFLDNENYKVLAVKGNLGVGKTHLVQSFLYKHKGEYYYYGSVFGISSIEQLKSRILANNKNQAGSNSANEFLANIFEGFHRNSERLQRTTKIDLPLPGQTSIPVVGSLISMAGDLALNILFNGIKNSIICIDDLESKSKFPLDELLGFVEYLVQELKCKIILIDNEDILLEDAASKKALEHYRQKVIDREFKLDPTVEENLDFIFKDNPDIEVIKSVFINAGTNNIRVIRKTKWLIDELIPLMKDWQPSLRNQVIRNSIVINLAKLDTGFFQRFAISIGAILSLIDSSKYQYKDQETSDKRIQLIQQTLLLGYTPLELDKLIIQSVETSLSISAESEFIKIGEILNQREQGVSIIEKIRSLGKPYYSSFGDSEQQIINEIITFLEENNFYLSISQFEQIEKFASVIELDISRYEKSLLEYMLKTLEPHYFNDLNVFRAKLRKYPDLEAYLEEKKNQYQQTLDITIALRKIINSNTQSISPWLKVDIEFLNNSTIDEYCQWLQEGHPDLYLMVRQFLDLGLPASQKLEQAIRSLAKNRKLNKIRAKFIYNIDIDNLSNNEH